MTPLRTQGREKQRGLGRHSVVDPVPQLQPYDKCTQHQTLAEETLHMLSKPPEALGILRLKIL